MYAHICVYTRTPRSCTHTHALTTADIYMCICTHTSHAYAHARANTNLCTCAHNYIHERVYMHSLLHASVHILAQSHACMLTCYSILLSAVVTLYVGVQMPSCFSIHRGTYNLIAVFAAKYWCNNLLLLYISPGISTAALNMLLRTLYLRGYSTLYRTILWSVLALLSSLSGCACSPKIVPWELRYHDTLCNCSVNWYIDFSI